MVFVPKKITLPPNIEVTILVPTLTSPLRKAELDRPFYLRSASTGQYAAQTDSGTVLSEKTHPWLLNGGVLINQKTGLPLFTETNPNRQTPPGSWRLTKLSHETAEAPSDQITYHTLFTLKSDRSLLTADGSSVRLTTTDSPTAGAFWWMEPIE